MSETLSCRLTLDFDVYDLEALRKLAVEKRDKIWGDTEEWLEGVGGIDSLSPEEALYEIVFASNNDVDLTEGICELMNSNI